MELTDYTDITELLRSIEQQLPRLNISSQILNDVKNLRIGIDHLFAERNKAVEEGLKAKQVIGDTCLKLSNVEEYMESLLHILMNFKTKYRELYHPPYVKTPKPSER